MTAPARTPEPEAPRVSGRLSVRFDAEGETTRTTVVERRPPLALVRAFAAEDGAALVHLHNVSGGVLGGDDLRTNLDVGPGARVLATTVGATCAYRSARGRESRALVEARVAAGGVLEYLPDPLIPFAGAIVSQTTTVELDEGAGLLWWEVVAPGRAARGEAFAYERVRLTTKIRAAGRLVVLERFEIEPARRPTVSAARLAGYGYFGTFFACLAGEPASRWTALEASLSDLAAEIEVPGETLVGASTLPAHGVVVRALSRSRRDLAGALERAWRLAKRELFGREAALPRKTR